ncbi:metal-dependent hydrolase (beta-lactamase superfamily II) [Bradyrhizobium sp. LM2.7]
MSKDWGFSALVEIAGKRIFFDTGNDPGVDWFYHALSAGEYLVTLGTIAILSVRH